MYYSTTLNAWLLLNTRVRTVTFQSLYSKSSSDARSCRFGDRCIICVRQLVCGQRNHAIDWEGTLLVARENQDSARRIRKAIWIKHTRNMNRDGGAYQLSDIYDAAIAKTTTSGDQKTGG